VTVAARLPQTAPIPYVRRYAVLDAPRSPIQPLHPSVRLSVYIHETTLEKLHEISWKSVLQICTKLCRHVQVPLKIVQ